MGIRIPIMMLLLVQPAICEDFPFSYTHHVPHVASGAFAAGRFRTSFVFFNSGNENEKVDLRLTADDGKPLVVTIPGLGKGSEFRFDLGPGAARILQTDGSGSLITGAAKVSASYSGTCVSAIFEIYDSSGSLVTETGVDDSPPLNYFSIPVEVTDKVNTGLALFNPAVVDITVDLLLRDTSGKEVARTGVIIPAGEHRARFVAGPGQFFGSIAGFTGTLTASCSAYLYAVALRQSATPLCYTSLPVANSLNLATSLFLPHVANGRFDQGSFRTSFILLNPDSSGAEVSLSLYKSDGTPLDVTLEGRGNGSSFDFHLEPYGSAFLRTDGTGPLTVGAAAISSDKLTGVAGIFSVFDAEGNFKTESGVGTAVPSAGLTLPVQITANSDTGFAFFNPGDASVEFTVKLLNADGEPAHANRKLSLGPRQHVAAFVSQLFPGTDNFLGSLASYAEGVVALTLRQNSVPLSYTTLPVAVGASEGKLAPLLPHTRTDVLVNRDKGIDAILSTGFNVTGKVTGQAVRSVFARSTEGEVFTSRWSFRGPVYSLSVPEGTHSFSVCYDTWGGAEASASILSTDAKPLVVPRDSTRDVVLPPVSFSGIRGTVTRLPSRLEYSTAWNRPSSSGLTVPIKPKTAYIVLTSLDYSVSVQQGIEDDGTYRTAVPPGSYRVSLYLRSVLNPDGSTADLTLFDIDRVNVGIHTLIANFAVPPLVRLSAVFSGAVATRRVRATDRAGPYETLDPCGSIPSFSSSSRNDSGRYQLMLPAGRSYDIQGESFLTQGEEFLGVLRCPAVPITMLDLSEDISVVLSEPLLPDAVTISGTVTDNEGHPAENAVVNVRSRSITGAPGVEFSNVTTTDENGEYRIKVLRGSAYRLVFTPRTPPAP